MSHARSVTILGGALAASLLAASAGAQPRALRPDDVFALRDVDDPEVSPEGKWVAYTVTALDAKEDASNADIYMAPLAGGPALRLTASHKSERSPRWSPDGRWLAFLSGRDGKKTQVWLMSREGGEAEKLTDFKASVSSLAWSPDSTRLALIVSDVDPDDDEADDDAAEASKEKDKNKKAKAPKPIVLHRLQFKRDTEGYLREVRSHVNVFDVATKSSVAVTAGPYDDSDLAWSPDGKWIAFSSNRTKEPDSNRDSDIFVVEARAGAAPRSLGTGPGEDQRPAWSPDGTSIVYEAGGDPKDMWYGSNHAAIVAVAGGAPRALTASLDRNVGRPRFSPDGRFVYFLLEDGGNRHLARVPTAGGAVERIVTGERDISAYSLSPKGDVALLASEPQIPSEIFSLGPGNALRRVTTVNDAFLKGIRLSTVERFKARSADGTMVDGFLTRPPGAAAGAKLPTVLRIHGGPVDQFSTEFNFEWQVLAGAGFAVVAANPRGSSGYGTAYSRAIWADWGNKDFQDVMAAVDHVVAMGVADPDRLGVGGWSYGGILTDYVITKTARFKAAVSGASEANFLSNYGTDHYQYEWETELGLPWQNVDRWVKLSPWFAIEKVTTPTLLMGGSDDMNVPLLNSEQLYQALRRLGRETELVIYPGQNHGIRRPSYVKDRYERYIAWYDHYLRASATAAAASGGARP
jgi:dipeptidyl aminopeptidase/acylaminoacyl peptidase